MLTRLTFSGWQLQIPRFITLVPILLFADELLIMSKAAQAYISSLMPGRTSQA